VTPAHVLALCPECMAEEDCNPLVCDHGEEPLPCAVEG
jgi:hypothetical protein